jgi:methenyltetrahydromethanopterin cyclohydrolase
MSFSMVGVVFSVQTPFRDGYDKNVHIEFGCCPVAAVFEDALQALVRNKDIIEKIGFIDVVLPDVDESYADALGRFESGKVNKVVFKPNGLDSA